MSPTEQIAVARLDLDTFQLVLKEDNKTRGAVIVNRARDRDNRAIGWRIKNKNGVKSGSASITWPTAAQALASTKILSSEAARAAIANAKSAHQQ
jgi:hypothetical protein